MSISNFLASLSDVTASSVDTTSPECRPNKCNARQTTLDASKTGIDETFWQPKQEFATSCSPVWLQYDLANVMPKTVYNLTIRYGSLSFAFDGQTQGNVKISPEITITSTNGNTNTAVDGKDYTFQSTVSSEEKTPFRLDAFLPLTSLMTENVKTIRITWNNLVPRAAANNSCQMNVDEVIIVGTTEKAGAASASSGLSGGAIAGIVIGILIILVAAGLLIMRLRNIARRKAANNLFPLQPRDQRLL